MKISDCKVELIDSMGTDISVVNAARVSFNKRSYYMYDDDDPSVEYMSEKDMKLLKYLAEHNHHTPFGHCFLSFRIKAPIFIARQLGKHQVGLCWNEVSRRYVDEEPEFFMPKIWRKKAENVKQGSSEEELPSPNRKGKCLFCSKELPQGRYKYCCDNHQAYHWQERNKYKFKFIRWKASAKANDIIFDITEEDLDWPKICPYLDIELNYESDNLADNVASLDKIIPELGYTKGNVQIISQLANKMKSSATKEQILTFAKNSSLIHAGVFFETADSYEKYLKNCADTYNKMIKEGYCAEQARIFMPQAMHTEWIWSGSLLAFIRVCNLRLDPHTQKETQDVAKQIAFYLDQRFPESWGVCKKYIENI
jgi:thymidylate synthase ThyX